MKISGQQTLKFGEEESTSLPGDSHVNHIAHPESERERKMTATSGRKCIEQFEKFNRNGLWAKTFAALLIGMEGWYSTRCKLTWKLKATKYSRFYFQLQVSERLTEGIGSGLLPTAQTQGLKVCEEGKTKFMDVGLLPTPDASLATGGKLTNQNKVSITGKTLEGKKRQISLSDYVRRILLPTPAASDWKGEYTMETVSKRGKDSSRGVRLPEEIARQTGNTSQLNPLFVGEMMGFPSDWLISPFLQKNPERESLEESRPTEDGEKKA